MYNYIFTLTSVRGNKVQISCVLQVFVLEYLFFLQLFTFSSSSVLSTPHILVLMHLRGIIDRHCTLPSQHQTDFNLSAHNTHSGRSKTEIDREGGCNEEKRCVSVSNLQRSCSHLTGFSGFACKTSNIIK